MQERKTHKKDFISKDWFHRARLVRLIPLFFWVGMIFYIFVVTRAAGGVIPLCFFHAVTGFDCPGCGLTRASTYFVRGQWLTSLRHHPGGMMFVTWLTTVTLVSTVEYFFGREIRFPKWVRFAYKQFTIIALTVTFTYGVVRLISELLGYTRPL